MQNENYPVLQEIIRLHNASVSVSEIAKRVNLNTAQIYGILRTLGGQKVMPKFRNLTDGELKEPEWWCNHHKESIKWLVTRMHDYFTREGE